MSKQDVMLFVNEGVVVEDPKTSKERKIESQVRLPDLDIDCAPGETCEVPLGYALPKRGDNGARRPSVIECLAPQLKPADLEYRKVWLQAPGPEDRRHKARLPTVADYVSQGVPEGVAEGLVAAANSAAAKAKAEGGRAA